MAERNRLTQNRNFVYRTKEQTDKKFDDLLAQYYGDRMDQFVTGNFQSINSLQGAKIKVSTDYDIYKMIQSGLMTDSNAPEELVQYVKDIINSAQGNIVNGYYDLGKLGSQAIAKGWKEDEELAKAAVDAGNVTICGYTSQSFTGGGSGTFKAPSKDFLFNSPLGKGLIDLGGFSGAALAEGLNTEGSDAIEEAGAGMAGSLIISFRDTLASLMDAILNSDEATPKIKPVIDTTDVRSKVSDIFKGLNFSTGIDVSTKTRDKSVVDAINGISNKEVVDAVNELASMVDNLRMQATRLQVVMDTGQLVGVLTPGIDQNLGMNAINAGRWVI